MLKLRMIAAIAAIALMAGPASAIVGIGSNGPDRMAGTRRADKLYGRNGPDVIHGRGGDDFLSGGHGPDSLYGGPGADVLWTGKGGSGGRDAAYGGPGNDRLHNYGSGHTQGLTVGGAGFDRCDVNRGEATRGCEVVRYR